MRIGLGRKQDEYLFVCSLYFLLFCQGLEGRIYAGMDGVICCSFFLQHFFLFARIWEENSRQADSCNWEELNVEL